MSHRHLFTASLVAFSLLIPFSSSGFAQHAGHGSPGMPSAQSTPTMAGEQMKRNVDPMTTNIASMLRDLSAMPTADGQSDRLLTGMNGMLEQMRGVSGGLAAMLNDPMLMPSDDATKAIKQASRDFEKMASAFQSMTKNMNQAMKGSHQGEK